MNLIVPACLILVLFALIGIGMAWAGYALFSAFLPLVGAAWSASITAFFFLFLAILICVVLSNAVRARFEQKLAAAAGRTGRSPEAMAMSALSAIAKDRPVLAVIAGAAIGAVSAFLRRRR